MTLTKPLRGVLEAIKRAKGRPYHMSQADVNAINRGDMDGLVSVRGFGKEGRTRAVFTPAGRAALQEQGR